MSRKGRRFGSAEDDLQDGITYDSVGRMGYHPSFHPNHGKPFTLDELIYISKFHGIDDIRTLSFAVGRTEHTVASKISMMRRDGRYEYYREMDFESWEEVCDKEK